MHIVLTVVQVGHTDFVTALAYSPPGELAEHAVIVSGSRDTTVRLWSPESEDQMGPALTGHEFQVTSVVLLPGSASGTALVASASLDSTLRLWDATGTCVRVLTGHTGPVLACLARPQSSQLWSGSGDGTIRVWTADGECVQTIPAHSDSVRLVVDCC